MQKLLFALLFLLINLSQQLEGNATEVEESGKEAVCEPGWVPYTRTSKNGENVVMCHFMTDIWGQFDTVRRRCREEHNAVISTFTTEEEYDILVNLTNNRPDNYKGYRFFIGYYKTRACEWIAVRTSNENGCTLENCFYSYEPGSDEITPEVRKLVASKFRHTEPDGSGQALGVFEGKILDEQVNHVNGYGMCMKKAEKKKKST
ncbi:unnamed protein product [Caenorhabditis angaria]|uniref:C-type lectin domain-containing protein n=1 Tax=Caenorhabditis angaria TaxID=860376 RepID=A0A9P1ISI6_9PELO|nr:unnamed protein product [Caenorhabditis angaria]